MSLPTADEAWAVYDLPLHELTAAEAAVTLPAPAESEDLVLLRNQAWLCSLRWLAVAGLAGLALLGWAATAVVRIPGLVRDPLGLLPVAGTLALLNLAWLRALRGVSLSGRRARLARLTLGLQILLDLAALTVVVHELGNGFPFAPFMYLFHIVLACIFFPYARSLAVTGAAMVMYLVLLLLERASVSALAGQLGSVAFVSLIVWYLASRLSNDLRKREQELSEANRRLVAATEERSNHMLQTTHQLKAPFAAIHANAQLLLAGHGGVLPGPAVGLIEQIAVRCEALSRGITSMLQLANLRSQAQNPPAPVTIDLVETVRACLAGLEPQASKRGILFQEDLRPAPVSVIRDHAVMIIDNVLSNAVSYSRDGQRIWVSSRPRADGGATVVIRDCGIGIPPDKLPRIFDDYFRTTEAARHNRGSTGLGLAIVRQSALASRVGVHVESAYGRGTVVSLDFPSQARRSIHGIPSDRGRRRGVRRRGRHRAAGAGSRDGDRDGELEGGGAHPRAAP